MSYVRYNCEEGAYNPVASLLLTTNEGAVKRLFSRRNSGDFIALNTFLAFVAYTLQNILLTGIPVPSGNFTGTMLIGGLVGRCVGALCRKVVPEGYLAASGVCAMVGSAAMLCGFKQISLSVVVFIVGAGGDFSLTPPLMMSVAISLTLNNWFLRRGFDEEQIYRKEVPFIPPEPPHALHRVRARSLCDLLPISAVLPPSAPLVTVRRALDEPGVLHFPVLRGGSTCLGFTTRSRLEAALRARACLDEDDQEDDVGLLDRQGLCKSSRLERGNGDDLPIARFVDHLAYTVLEGAFAHQIYSLFSKAGAEVLCVTSEAGEFRGMISRGHMVKLVREMELAPDGADDGSESVESGDDSDANRFSES